MSGEVINLGNVPVGLDVTQTGPMSFMVTGPGGFVEVTLPDPTGIPEYAYGAACWSVIEKAIADVQAMPPTVLGLGTISEEEPANLTDNKGDSTIYLNITATANVTTNKWKPIGSA